MQVILQSCCRTATNLSSALNVRDSNSSYTYRSIIIYVCSFFGVFNRKSQDHVSFLVFFFPPFSLFPAPCGKSEEGWIRGCHDVCRRKTVGSSKSVDLSFKWRAPSMVPGSNVYFAMSTYHCIITVSVSRPCRQRPFPSPLSSSSPIASWFC